MQKKILIIPKIALEHTLRRKGLHKNMQVNFWDTSASTRKSRRDFLGRPLRGKFCNILIAKFGIIDDDPIVFQLIKRALGFKGYLVSTSTDGEAGVKQIEENTPDLVILDLMLPKISGKEICRKIKANEKTESIPIVMLAGKGCDTDKVICKLLGVNYYMTKPFDLYELLKKIAELLREPNPA